MGIDTPATKLSKSQLQRLEYMMSLTNAANAVDLVCREQLSPEERETLTKQLAGELPVEWWT
jgi:hypothetical protein